MIIGLCGQKGSGKDTAGAYLVEKYGFERRSFAIKIKEAFAALFDIDVEQVDKLKLNDKCEVMIVHELKGRSELIESRLTMREVLQRFGTEMGRNVFGEDFWVDLCLPIAPNVLPNANIVVTDVRFPNECQRIIDLGGVVWQIYRQSADTLDPHASEDIEAIQPYTEWTIFNNGTIEKLHNELDAAYFYDNRDE